MTVVDFVLENRSVDHDVGNVRIDYGHQIEGLNNFGAVLAAERNIGFELIGSFEISDLLDDVRFHFWRISTGLEQRQYE